MGGKAAVGPARSRGGGLAGGVAILALVLWLGVVSDSLAQEPAAAVGSTELRLDTLSLSDAPWSTAETLLEKTIFQVNVLTLTLRLGRDETVRVGNLLRGRLQGETLEDSIARTAAAARNALARIEFHRTVSLKQFTKAVSSNLRKAAVDAYISAADAEQIGAAIPRWFSFLAERGIHKGDRILYRIRGDTLRTVFLSVDGELLLDQTDVGPERRLAVLGSYFARGSDFRKGLLSSLFASARSAPGPSGDEAVEPAIGKTFEEPQAERSSPRQDEAAGPRPLRGEHLENDLRHAPGRKAGPARL